MSHASPVAARAPVASVTPRHTLTKNATAHNTGVEPTRHKTTGPRPPRTCIGPTSAAGLTTNNGTPPPPQESGRENRTKPYSAGHRVANGTDTIRHKLAVLKHITGVTSHATLHAEFSTTWTPSVEQAELTPPHCPSPITHNPIANARPSAHPSTTVPVPLFVAYDEPRAPPKFGHPHAAKIPPPYTKTSPTPRPRTSTMVPGVEKVHVQENGKAK